jgi:hypothetical protein
MHGITRQDSLVHLPQDGLTGALLHGLAREVG